MPERHPELQEPTASSLLEEQVGLAPPDALDPVVEAYKKDVDRTLLRENLKLAPADRARKFLAVLKFMTELSNAGRRARAADPGWGLGP